MRGINVDVMNGGPLSEARRSSRETSLDVQIAMDKALLFAAPGCGGWTTGPCPKDEEGCPAQRRAAPSASLDHKPNRALQDISV